MAVCLPQIVMMVFAALSLEGGDGDGGGNCGGDGCDVCVSMPTSERERE